MRKALLALAMAAPLAGSFAADAAKDTQDLDKIHSQIEETITALGRAQETHHDQLGGHAQKAADLLNQAAHEVRAAIETASKPPAAKSPK
jgi:polyisoprenoid-binding protein YceI